MMLVRGNRNRRAGLKPPRCRMHVGAYPTNVQMAVTKAMAPEQQPDQHTPSSPSPPVNTAHTHPCHPQVMMDETGGEEQPTP